MYPPHITKTANFWLKILLPNCHEPYIVPIQIAAILQGSELAAGNSEEEKLKEVVVVVEEEEESQERLDRLRASTVALKNASSEYCSFVVVEECAPEICG
jgi:hypothetical protein